MKPTKEQEQKFWEHFGFWEMSWPSHPRPTGAWFSPDNIQLDTLPDIDLNNLFKYAVPKLDINDRVEISWSPVKGYRDYKADVVTWKPDTIARHHRWTAHEDPALALFWAIWGVIKL